MEASVCAAYGITFFCSLWLKTPFLKINKCKISNVIKISVKYVMLLCPPFTYSDELQLANSQIIRDLLVFGAFRSAMHCTVLDFQLFPSLE